MNVPFFPLKKCAVFHAEKPVRTSKIKVKNRFQANFFIPTPCLPKDVFYGNIFLAETEKGEAVLFIRLLNEKKSPIFANQLARFLSFTNEELEKLDKELEK